ncbi:T9SS type A sorting domain-containing protein [Polaribacter sp. P097]|uniref:T9SS type A sorting domain-containing protein n=1 Tax=Polaribacter sp. P097 TaxID=3117398 RepID=UPI002FE2D6BF
MIKKIFLFLLLILSINLGFSQIENFKDRFELPSDVSETSGLLFLDGKIITHNDSGDAANLYELDSLTGNLLRTVTISNATNVDWEDITEDETYIYIGDFGNNNGDRTDLKIYRIAKSDYLTNDTVTAETISFAYEDQTDFTVRTNMHNFDAEAFVVIDNSLYIFSKNWADLKSNLYKIPKAIGNYTAEKISTGDVEGLITGATVNSEAYLLCGSDSAANPFIIYIRRSPIFSEDIFFAGFDKTTLSSSQLEQFSQVEAITSFDNGKFYISREKVDSNGISLTQKLYEFKDDRLKTLSTKNQEFKNFTITPNPASDFINFSNYDHVKSLSIYSTLGKEVFKLTNMSSQVNISNLPKGMYLVKVNFENESAITKKLIKL